MNEAQLAPIFRDLSQATSDLGNVYHQLADSHFSDGVQLGQLLDQVTAKNARVKDLIKQAEDAWPDFGSALDGAQPLPEPDQPSNPTPTPDQPTPDQPTPDQPTPEPDTIVKQTVNPQYRGECQSAANRASDATLKKAFQRLSEQPTAFWLNGADSDVKTIQDALQGAKADDSTPVFAHYMIPLRDASGQWSSGGSANADDYRSKTRARAQAFGDAHAVVILEPDAVPDLPAIPEASRDERLHLIGEAVDIYAEEAPNVEVFIDAGHSQWPGIDVLVPRLQAAGVERAAGFAGNTSNTQPLNAMKDWVRNLAVKLGSNVQGVIDVSRAGNSYGSGEWCNPTDAKVGPDPDFTVQDALRATLWVKPPGESDGLCNGGPGAGQWSDDLAAKLVQGTRFTAA